MKDLCVLFLHHDASTVTRRHADLIRVLNPQAAFVPLSFQSGLPTKVTPKSWLLSQCQPGRDKGSQWWHVDRLVWEWFRSRHRVEAKRYLLIESDTLCLEPFPSFYERVWDADAAGSDVVSPATHPEYNFWRYSPVGGPALSALCPVSGVLLSLSAMRAGADMVLREFYEHLYCEIRLGTVVQHCGFLARQIRADAQRFISWETRRPDALHGIWHRCTEMIELP